MVSAEERGGRQAGTDWGWTRGRAGGEADGLRRGSGETTGVGVGFEGLKVGIGSCR